MDFRSVCSYGSTALRAVGVSGQCSNQLSYPPPISGFNERNGINGHIGIQEILFVLLLFPPAPLPNRYSACARI